MGISPRACGFKRERLIMVLACAQVVVQDQVSLEWGMTKEVKER